MSLKMFLRHKNRLLLCFAALLFSNLDSLQAQCAGTDAVITICNIADPANQNLDLFALLGPTATPGGTWTDPVQSGALNTATGVLNVWEVNFSGTFIYTYTVTGVPGCADNTATVAVTIGGYSGVPSPNGTACSDDTSVNLFSFFVGENVPDPQFNGVWTANSPVNGLAGSILNAEVCGVGTFSFTYTMPAIGSCPAQSSIVVVTIYRAPVPGTGADIVLCDNADFSLYTNVNLFGQLSGEDGNGLWTETGTGQLSGPFDSFINIQDLFNTYGVGVYGFSYTVFPSNPICSPKTTQINIKIESIIDLTGGSFVVNYDICENEIATATYEGVIIQGPQPVPDGGYQIAYHIEGPGVSADFTVQDQFDGGGCQFDIAPINFNQVGSYTVHLTGITKTSSANTCENIIDLTDVLNIFPTPNLDNAIIAINPICKNSDGTVTITGIGNLADGNYQIDYKLLGSNKAFDQQIVVAVVNGTATFQIPANLITNTGTTTLIFSHITDLLTGCDAVVTNFKTFTVVDLPYIDNLTVNVPSACQTLNVPVVISQLGVMTSIEVTYDLTGANMASGQTATFTANLGNGTFVIPSALLPNLGSTTITITSVHDLVTGCAIDANIPEKFVVTALPDLTALTATIADVCRNQQVSVALSGFGNISDFQITYSFSGANTTTELTAILNATLGDAVFTVPSALITNSGATTFTIISIRDLTTNCPSPSGLQIPFTINPLPDVANFNVTIPNTCKNQPVVVQLSNLGDINNLTITYNLTGANTASDQIQAIAVSGGTAAFVIPAALLANTGNTTFTITNTVNTGTGCISTVSLSQSITINPFPDLASLTATIADFCEGQPVTVQLSGLGSLTNANITYNITGANSATAQTATVTVTSGNASFVIPATLVANTGDNVFIITSVGNNQTTCETASTVADAFKINEEPSAPIASDVIYCANQNPTVADLQPSGSQYKWYDSATSTTALANDSALVNGNYYVTQTNSSNCVSEKTMITVVITELQPPVLNADGQNFCGADNPTIADLSANAVSDNAIIWFDAPSGGNQFSNADFLQQGFTYYGFDFSQTMDCASEDALVVTVSLTICDDDPGAYDFFIPDGFSPNNDNVNDTWKIPDIQFLYPDYTYEIYNRYGNVLFKGNINKPEWDGKNSESSNVIDGIAPNGVYFYVVNFNKGNKPPKQGRLYLNR